MAFDDLVIRSHIAPPLPYFINEAVMHPVGFKGRGHRP